MMHQPILHILTEDRHTPRAGHKTLEIALLMSQLPSRQSTEQQSRVSAMIFSQARRRCLEDLLHDLVTRPLP